MPYLIDTNILLRSVDPNHPMYPDATNGLNQLRKKKESLYITSQNIIEFWNVYTRPKEKNGLGGTVTEVQAEISQIKSFFHLLPDTSMIYQKWEQLVNHYQVKGVNVHDARLVAVMLIHQITHILTFNTDDFKRYLEITAVNPGTMIL